MKTSMLRVHLCMVAVVAVCGSGRGSSAVQLSTNGLPPKSEYQPGCDSKTTEVKCLSNWEEVFCSLQKEAKEKRTPLLPILDFSPPLLLTHIHARDASGANSSSSYCQLSDSVDECIMFAVYSHSIFDVYPGALLISLVGTFEVFTHFQHWLSMTIVETSWTLPLPVCSRHEPDILRDYVYELIKSTSNNNQFVDNVVLPFRVESQLRYSIMNAIILYLLPIFLSSAILLALCWHSKRYPLHHQKSRNSVSKSLLLSTMLQSWMWFTYLYGYQFRGLSVFKDFLHSRNAVISTSFMPFVDIGYYAFGIMGVFYLVEFPVLLWYISTKVMAMDRRRLNRRQCMLYILKSIGYAGMVLFMQVVSWYFMYCLIILLAYPLFVILILGAYFIIFIFLTASTALLLLPCLTRCKRCPQQSGPIVFLVLTALICGAFIVFLSYGLEGKWHASYDANQIMSGIFGSGILALLVYTTRSVLTQYMLTSDSQVGTNKSDEQTLLSAEMNP